MHRGTVTASLQSNNALRLQSNNSPTMIGPPPTHRGTVTASLQSNNALRLQSNSPTMIGPLNASRDCHGIATVQQRIAATVQQSYNDWSPPTHRGTVTASLQSNNALRLQFHKINAATFPQCNAVTSPQYKTTSRTTQRCYSPTIQRVGLAKCD